MDNAADIVVPFDEFDDSLSLLEKCEQGRVHGLLSPVAMPFQLPTPIYGAMLAVWHLRPILQRRFPLHKGRQRDYIRFISWCAIEGRRQFAIFRSIPDWDDALTHPVSLPLLKGDLWSGGFSVAMFLYGVARYRFFLGPMLKDAKARNRIAGEFWSGERNKYMFPSPAAWQLKFLDDRFANFRSFIGSLQNTPSTTESSDAQLAEKFGLVDILDFFNLNKECLSLTCSSPLAVPSFAKANPQGNLKRSVIQGITPTNGFCRSLMKSSRNALFTDLASKFYFPLPIPFLREALWLSDRLKRRPNQFQLASVIKHIPTIRPDTIRFPYPFGVNLFGYAQGEIGIGEDVRLIASALKSQNIPFCIVNVKPGDHVSQKDNSVDHWIVQRPRYAINIFCITGIEQVRFACTEGLELMQGRYNIGFWPWELPEWPASCSHAFSLVDELWGISSYTADAYRRSELPVYPMSLPVSIGGIAPLGRKDFGLPEGDYLFVFSFDFNSTLVRKNPEAVIHAFKRAFDKNSGEKVGLVLKASHVTEKNKEWQRVRRLIEADSRIYVIDQTLRRAQVMALYKCCDCYVSLHRAEGFGRGMAEALMLDLQLIATAFSGNLDFCTDERVGLVRFEHRNVRRMEYFHADGQDWADPDVDHAAELMRSIRSNPRSIVPKNFDFSPEKMGTRYAQRLHEIREQYNIKESYRR